MDRLVLVLLLVLLPAVSAARVSNCPNLQAQLNPGLCSDVHIHGVNFTFATAVTCNQFANGDWWVLAPVTISAISTGFDGQSNGYEVDPSSWGKQGFDYRISGFDASLVPALPLVLSGDATVVAALSSLPLNNTGCRPCLRRAVTLTVLSVLPPDGTGLSYFRPAYFNRTRTYFGLDDIQANLMPSVNASKALRSSLTLSTVASWFEKVQLDNKENWVGRFIHPTDNMPDYGSNIALRTHSAAVRISFSDVKELLASGTADCALVRYLQVGIDWGSLFKAGMTYPANGGHTLGRKLPICITALLLGDSSLEQEVKARSGWNRADFHEDAMIKRTVTAPFVPVFGQSANEITYWNNVRFDAGIRTAHDPYGYVDGGRRPGTSYQYCCVSQPYKGAELALDLFGARLQEVWSWPEFSEYVRRWVYNGTWALPDPCAPAIGNCSGGDLAGQVCSTANESLCTLGGGSCKFFTSGYGVNYGPDGNGSCILDTDPSDGIGRYPLLHLDPARVDAGLYRSTFVDAAFPELYRLGPLSFGRTTSGTGSSTSTSGIGSSSTTTFGGSSSTSGAGSSPTISGELDAVSLATYLLLPYLLALSCVLFVST